MKIGSFDVTRRVFLIAEIGNNHEGSVERARTLVEEAARAKADAVKFQTSWAEHFISREQRERFERLKRFELPRSSWKELAMLAHDRGLAFLSTPLDIGSVDLLEPHLDAFKVASGDLLTFPLLAHIAKTRKPVIVSTGASTLEEVRRAVAFLRDWGVESLALLHCVSCYPTPPEAVNLAVLETLRAVFPGIPIGYSDHTLGQEACIAAVGAGARIIEKHFTLDKNLSDFPDHRLSATPDELAELAAAIRRIEVLRGSPEKSPQPCEEKIRATIRRSVAAGRDLPRGHRIAMEDLAWVRPAGGVAPGNEAQLLGRRLVRDVALGERILPDDVE